jgi:hypothetical protein
VILEINFMNYFERRMMHEKKSECRGSRKNGSAVFIVQAWMEKPGEEKSPESVEVQTR